jgi:hypothetical protein
MLACVGLLVLLFYPYVWVQARYQYRRDWTDVLDVLPRPQSFLLSDVSSLWRHPNAGIFRDLPSRHEHQMFIGAAPLLFALIGAIRSVEKNSRTTKLYMVGMIALPIVATLWLNGWTLWKVFFALPLASAIKVITRVDQALLFPIAFLAAFGVQAMIDRKRRLITGFAVALSGFLILEAALVDMPTSAKQEWRDRSAALETQLPDVVDQNRILFVAQRSGPNYADELDVMWYALKAGVPTMNGYSGYAPWGYGWDYGTECSTIPNRVLWYLEFEDREHDLEAYRSLMARIEHIGFTNCDPRWWDEFTGY